ncbi:MAG: hypothetical protein KAR57_07000 [Bacteroidales bacterium]|nr:hypothetical protein [Bacteroidales bacterium]
MKNIMIFTGIILFSSLLTLAQDCKFYYPKTQGAQLEFKSFDKKDKLTGSSIQTIKEISETGNLISAVIEVQSFDKKGKDLGKKEFSVQCENGEYSVDMKSFMDPQTMEAYEEMDVKVKSDNLEIPASLNVGDDLGNGKLEISVYSEGMRIMGMTTDITQRKVEAKEEITTEAGTFDCYKITYTITVKTMFSVRMEAAEWIAEGVGTVKSETYSNEKTMGYTLLTGIKK